MKNFMITVLALVGSSSAFAKSYTCLNADRTVVAKVTESMSFASNENYDHDFNQPSKTIYEWSVDGKSIASRDIDSTKFSATESLGTVENQDGQHFSVFKQTVVLKTKVDVRYRSTFILDTNGLNADDIPVAKPVYVGVRELSETLSCYTRI